MNVFLIPSLAALSLLIVGIYRVLVLDYKGMKIKVTLAERIRLTSNMEIDLDEEDMPRSYLDKLKTFNYIRVFSFSIVLLILMCNIKRNMLKIGILCLIFLLSSPKKMMFGIPSPVKRAIDSYKIKKSLELDKEIFSSAGTIKTLALLNSNGTFSADYIYEKLFEHSVKMKGIYSSFLALYRSGSRQEAFKYIRKNINTNTGKQFATILEKLEYLSPKEMVQQIEGFQEAIVEERTTRATNEIDKNSVITTVASTATIFTIILNFAIVGVFMDSLAMLNGIF